MSDTGEEKEVREVSWRRGKRGKEEGRLCGKRPKKERTKDRGKEIEEKSIRISFASG